MVIWACLLLGGILNGISRYYKAVKRSRFVLPSERELCNSIDDKATNKMTSLTYLEFYSGIGGWGYALEHACRSINNKNKNDSNDGSILLQPQLLAAYDHSDLCNSVLLNNHQSPNMSSSSIPENTNN